MPRADASVSRLRALVHLLVFGVLLVGLFAVEELPFVRGLFTDLPAGYSVPVQVFVNAQVLVVAVLAMTQRDPDPATTLGLARRDGIGKTLVFGFFVYFAILLTVVMLAVVVASADVFKDPELLAAPHSRLGLRGLSDPRVLEEIARVPTALAVPLMMFVGLYEEVLFRGFLLSRLKSLVGGEGALATLVAVVVSSAAFAAVHTYKDALGIAATFVLGLAFAIVTVLRKQIYSAVVAHALLDLTVLGVLHAVPAALEQLKHAR